MHENQITTFTFSCNLICCSNACLDNQRPIPWSSPMLLLVYLRFSVMHHVCLTLFSCLGKYQSGVDKPDPKTWKANFRCAMNSLPDIEEVKDKSIKKGNNAFRVYRMLPLSERPSKKGRGESLWVWSWWCWLHCYHGACIVCQFYFSCCKVRLFHPAVPWNLGTSLWKTGCIQLRERAARSTR